MIDGRCQVEGNLNDYISLIAVIFGIGEFDSGLALVGELVSVLSLSEKDRRHVSLIEMSRKPLDPFQTQKKNTTWIGKMFISPFALCIESVHEPRSRIPAA